jgi:hypothetical protein
MALFLTFAGPSSSARGRTLKRDEHRVCFILDQQMRRLACVTSKDENGSLSAGELPRELGTTDGLAGSLATLWIEALALWSC